MPGINYVTVGAVVLAFVIAAIVARVGRAIIQRLLTALDVVEAEHLDAVRARARQLTGALTLLAYGAAALASLSLALERFGVNEPEWHPRLLLHWVLTHGVNVAIILASAFIIERAANLGVDQFQFNFARRRGDLESQRRATTLASLLTRLISVAVVFVAVLMLLRELSIDILPILTGAGIVGLAIGFGAQNLVRDVIAGFFIILEDQVRVGDQARINNVTGIVEEINLRTVILRDGDGAVQVFPNGTITALANLSKQFANAVVDVQIAYAENVDRVFGTMREVGASMEHDPAWSALVLGPLDILGIESLADGAATVRVKFKTQPLNQGRVASELRRRLMTTLVGRGIKPFA